MYYKKKKWLLCALVIFINTLMIGAIISFGKNRIFDYKTEKLTLDGVEKRIEIHNEEEFLAFAEDVQSGKDYKDSEIVLCADLNLSEYKNFFTIGEAEEPIIFRGMLDGNGYHISGIDISNPSGRAAIFAYLDGTVKNLQIVNSNFMGDVCGAIAAETGYNAAILNCYLEVQVEGEISGAAVGVLNGNLFNCVASSDAVGKHGAGVIDQIYLCGEEDINSLNENLHHVSAYYRDISFCEWEKDENSMISHAKKELLESLSAHLIAGDTELTFKGYYSIADRQWCIALPATYGDDELFLEAKTNNGTLQSFKRSSDETQVLLTMAQHEYLINFLSADNVDTLYVFLQKGKTLEDVHANKEIEFPGRLAVIDKEGKIGYEPVKGFYGHGNSSWDSQKKSYNLKFDSYVDLLGMGENDDYALLAGYRMNSLMSYCVMNEFTKELGFEFAPEFRLVNLFVEGEYAGVYFITEKIELDKNRLEITSVYDETRKVNSKSLDSFEYIMWLDEVTKQKRYYYTVEKNPDDITGGYLLEMDVADYGPDESRFITIGRKNKITLKKAHYSSEEQVTYISQYWQEFENALLSEDGINEKGKYYAEYIDLESFAMQWLIYELAQEDSMKSSVYFYKESDLSGDGLLHACYPWDVERSFIMLDKLDVFWNVDKKGGYWAAFYAHEDFRKEVYRLWKEKFIPAVDAMIANNVIETESGLKNLSWYQSQIGAISRLEQTRWLGANMLEKCDAIRYVLSVRKDVLTSIFESQ